MPTQNSLSAQSVAIRTATNLSKRGFNGEFLQSRDELVSRLKGFITPGSTVGISGTTIIHLQIPELAENLGAIVFDHNKEGLSPDEKLECRRNQLRCDLFISSSNAITEDGIIVNVDGTGNRVAALSFGPRRNVIIIGTNKIVKDENAAWQRIAEIAAPMNNKRLKRPNPCVKTDVCCDCHLETRICRIYHSLKYCPTNSIFSVFILDEKLGF